MTEFFKTMKQDDRLQALARRFAENTESLTAEEKAEMIARFERCADGLALWISGDLETDFFDLWQE
jgi:hypothetical protein